MSSAWKTVVIVVGALLLTGLGYWLFTHYKSIKGPQSAALEAIDPEVVFFAQSDDIRAALYKLTNETEYWPVLLSDSLLHRFQEQFGYLDSLVSSHGWLNELIELRKSTIALNRSSSGDYNFTFYLELPPGDFLQSFGDFIRSVNGEQSIVMQRDFERAVIHTVNLAGPEELLFYTVYKGLFITSFDESLVERSIQQLNSKASLSRDQAFQRIHKTAGKNVESNLYIRIPNFIAWAGEHLTDRFFSLVEELEKFGTWTEIDLLVNSDDLLFNGYTISDDTSAALLDRFRHVAQPIRVPQILPYNVPWMMHWGIDDFKEFLRTSSSPDELKSVFSGYERDFGIDLESGFVSWVGHELVLTTFPPRTGRSHPMVIIHSEDVVQAALALGEMESKVNRKNRTPAFILTNKDYNIRKLGLNRLFSDLFGAPFPVMEDCYYVTLKDYIVFSDNHQSLVQVIDDFYNQKTLSESVSYQAFSDNISDRSNIYLYCKLKEPDPALEAVVEGAGATNLLNALSRFEGFALQFTFINNMFYTSMFLSYNPEYRIVTSSNWETVLEAPVATPPQMVRNHRSGKTNIIVFDETNNMYLLDHVGRIQWKLPLVEAPAGEVFMVDYYNNGKYQYLFNTVNYVYLVDLNGNYVADFPAKLIAPSTSPMALIDYDNDGNYRLLIALEDNKVYNYNLQLSGVEGWDKVQATGTVHKPIQYLRNGGKDYLLVCDDQGHVKITDRRGRERITPGSEIHLAENSRFYINRTNSKGLFLTTDSNGKVIYIEEKGRVNRTDFGTFDPGHYFFYEDFDGDDHHDFIFIDRNRIVVFDRFKKLITEQHITEVVTRTPVLFSWAGRRYIGVVLDAVGEIQVYDYQGRRFREQFLEGGLPFATGYLDEGRLNLITGKGSKVLNYQLN